MTIRSIVAVLGCLAIPAVVQGQGRGQGQVPAPQGQLLGGPAGARREVTVTAISGVIAAGARWTLAWQGTDNADGIVGTEDGGLLFAQEQPNRVSKLDQNDQVSVFVQNTRGAGSVSLDARGRLVAAQRTCTDPGRREPCPEPPAIGVIYPEGERRILAERFEGQSIGRPNDLVASRQGTVYFTSGGAFSINPSGTVSSIGTGLRTNGIMLSPDEKTLYITNGPVVVAFDVQPDGTVRNQRDFAKLEAGGAGDGMAIDAAGRLYVTSQPGVQVFSADGKYLGLIPTPRAVASVAFSGPGKRTLYVTGAGALGPDGTEISTPPGVRNNAKSIFKIPMLAQGFTGRAK
jgi:gluconolactonase